MSTEQKLEKLENLENKLQSCNKCQLLINSRKKVVPGYGYYNSPVMFVGLAPGRNGADVTGIPFTRDRSGQLFQEMLVAANIIDAYITNLVKCNPKDATGRNRTPSKAEVKNCIDYLSEEISIIKPKVIVCLGKVVTEVLVGRPIKNFLSFRLNPIKIGEICYLPFLHPAFVIRGAYEISKYQEDFLRLSKFVSDICNDA